MSDASTQFHEPLDQLRPETVEAHRGVATLLEELEAIDWYDQRLDAASDPQLRAILEHNRDEEKEHAMMALEWLRRHDPVLDEHMRTYLFTDDDIVAVEEDAENVAGDADVSLNIGHLRGEF